MSKKALVIEDNELVLETLNAMLEFFGFQVTLARTGREGIEKYKSEISIGETFDVVFVDLVLPEMHGTLVMEELRKIDPNINAIISSGFYEDPSIKDYEKLGFKGILNKPYTVEELKDILTKLGLF